MGAAEITPDQRDEIASILDLAQTKVGPLAGELSGFREQVAILIAADVVNRAAFETIRKEALTALDVLSEQGMEAFLNAAEVLTAEQRAALLDRFGCFGRGFGPGFGPGRGTTDQVSYR